MARNIDRGRFIALLTERFPEVIAEIDDCIQGLLHMEMAVLAHATQSAIDAGDGGTVTCHFEFVDAVFADATQEVENTVYVSYLENLRFEGRKAGPMKARELLPPRLRRALAELEAHLAKIHGSDERI